MASDCGAPSAVASFCEGVAMANLLDGRWQRGVRKGRRHIALWARCCLVTRSVLEREGRTSQQY